MLYTTDTTRESEEVQLGVMRSLSGSDRIRQVCTLNDHLRSMAFAAIRRRFPNLSEVEVKIKFIELTYGKALADAVRHKQQMESAIDAA